MRAAWKQKLVWQVIVVRYARDVVRGRACGHSQQATGSLLLGDGGKPEGVQKAVALGVEVRVVGPKVRAELAAREALR